MPEQTVTIEALAEAVICLADAVERMASRACDFEATGDAQIARDIALLVGGRDVPRTVRLDRTAAGQPF